MSLLPARKEYGDAAIFVFEGISPDYISKTFKEQCATDGIAGIEKLKGFQQRHYVQLQKEPRDCVRTFKQNLASLHHDILLHLSDESRLLITKDATAQDPKALWDVIQKAHTVKNRTVTDEELKALKSLHESLRQLQGGSCMELIYYDKSGTRR
jgi:hypothetical protein